MGDSLRNPFHVDKLPLLGRLHQRAFRAGSPDGNPLLRLFARAAFYALRSMSRQPVWGEMTVDFAGDKRKAKFDARNRMFCAVYFDKYQHGVEPTVMGLIDKLMPNDGVFYDIGANWGYHSICLAARPGFRGQIHSFEPTPQTFADMQGLVRELKATRAINCHNMAIGERDEQGFIECGNHSGLARLSNEGKGFAVQIRALDTLGLPPPDVMKVDTEGHEEQVFRGGENLIKKHKPLIVFEHRYESNTPSGEERRVLEQLESYGYQLFMPSWRGKHAEEVEDPAILRHPALVSEGLQLYDCTSKSRFDYPEFPDLFACHRDKISMLKNISKMSLKRAA